MKRLLIIGFMLLVAVTATFGHDLTGNPYADTHELMRDMKTALVLVRSGRSEFISGRVHFVHVNREEYSVTLFPDGSAIIYTEIPITRWMMFKYGMKHREVYSEYYNIGMLPYGDPVVNGSQYEWRVSDTAVFYVDINEFWMRIEFTLSID